MSETNINTGQIADVHQAEAMAYAAKPHMDSALHAERMSNEPNYRSLIYAISSIAARETIELGPDHFNQVATSQRAAADVAANQEGEAFVQRDAEFQQYRSEIREQSAGQEDQIITDYFSYDDAEIPQETKDSMLASNMESISAQKYATSLAELMTEFGKEDVLKQADAIRTKAVDELKDAGLPVSPITKSLSWVLWDMAKQEYFYQHADEAESGYQPGDPMQTQRKPDEIADRHVGWEVHGIMQQNPEADFFSTYPDRRWIDKAIGQVEPKPDGSLSSKDYETLGSAVRFCNLYQKLPSEMRELITEPKTDPLLIGVH